MKKFFLILRQGNKVISASSFIAPSIDGLVLPQLDSGIIREWVNEDYTHITLPALWNNGNITPLPEKPADHFVFDFNDLVWVEDLSIIWDNVRNKRNRLLSKTDIDIARILEQEDQIVPSALIEYRQALRDITLQHDPSSIVWPTPPVLYDHEQTYPVFKGIAKLDKLFTVEEQEAIIASTMVSPHIKRIYDRFMSAAYLTYTDPEVEAGLQFLVQENLLTPERKYKVVQLMLPPALRD